MQWSPEPGVTFDLDDNGICQADPEGYASALAKNQALNQALQAAEDALPDEMKKNVLDSDGDPTGQRVIKDKHRPQARYDAKGAIVITQAAEAANAEVSGV